MSNAPSPPAAASPARILFIAIDAGDRDLILAWAKEGVLPTFRSLLEESAWGPTVNPTGLFVGAIWPSFWTGLSPGRHGRYCFSQLRAGTYEEHPVPARETAGQPFWDVLSAAGRRVAIVDVPKTRLSSHLNGIHVVDWGTHDPEDGFSTWPEALAPEILARFGAHPVGQCDTAMARDAAGFAGLRDALVRGIETKGQLAAHYLEQGGWDLFLAVFAESHCVGHQCWHLRDPGHPQYDPDVALTLGDPVRDVYRAIDAELGRLLERSGPDATVFVLASHGMGPHYDATFLLDEMLRRLVEAPPHPANRAVARLLESAWHRFPRALRLSLRGLRGRAKQALGGAASLPELGSRTCFSIPNNDVYGAIRVNLMGREPEGRIRPGAEYEAFCDALVRDLSSFVNLDTDKPLVKRVLRADELYQGEHLADLPDLLVEWDREAPISRIYSPKTGVIEGLYGGRRTGDHKADGVVFVRGPGIQPRRLERPVDITQFAPTIASLLGVALEADADPIDELTRRGGQFSAAP